MPALVCNGVHTVKLISVFSACIGNIIRIHMNLIVISAVITAIFFGAVFVKAHSVCSFAVENQLARRSALIKRQFIFQRLISIHSFLHGSIFKIFAFENISMRRERILGLRKNLIYRSLFAAVYLRSLHCKRLYVFLSSSAAAARYNDSAVDHKCSLLGKIPRIAVIKHSVVYDLRITGVRHYSKQLSALCDSRRHYIYEAAHVKRARNAVKTDCVYSTAR